MSSINSTTSRPAFDVQSVIKRVSAARAAANPVASAVSSGRLDPATKLTISDGTKAYQSNRGVGESLAFEKRLAASGGSADQLQAARKSFYGSPSAGEATASTVPSARSSAPSADFEAAQAWKRNNDARLAADGLSTVERNRIGVEATVAAARESGKSLSAESRAFGAAFVANQGPGFSVQDVKSAVGKYEATQRFAANIDRFAGGDDKQRDALAEVVNRIAGGAKTTIESYRDIVTSFQNSGRSANVAEQAKALGIGS